MLPTSVPINCYNTNLLFYFCYFNFCNSQLCQYLIVIVILLKFDKYKPFKSSQCLQSLTIMCFVHQQLTKQQYRIYKLCVCLIIIIITLMLSSINSSIGLAYYLIFSITHGHAYILVNNVLWWKSLNVAYPKIVNPRREIKR